MGNLKTDQLIDCVNDHDIPIGVINRKDLPSQPANFRVVHVFVFDQEHRLLLQTIASNQRSTGLKGSSVAGYVGAGETYVAAAVRKLNAELGISSPLVFVGKTAMPDLGAKKFISLFRTSHPGPFAFDPQQISSVQFETPSAIEAELRSWPERFTETFRHLFAFQSAARNP